MAEIHDDFTNPERHDAPGKTVVESVIDHFIKLGNIGVSLASGLLAAVLVIYSGYVIADQFSTQYKAYSSAWDLLRYKPEFIEDGDVPLSGMSLASVNEDYRAWLTVYDTSIDYPVMQGENDLYYASHDIYKNSSLTGAIYMAAGNSSDFSDSYNLIYGHHMDNGAMFGRLDSFKEADYYNAHREGVIVAQSGIYDVTFIAVVNTDAYENRIYSVGNRMDDVLAFLASGGEGGVGLGTTVLQYDPEVLEGAQKIVALSTCANATTSGRLVVFGVMTLRETPTTSATVTKVWNDNNDQDGLRPESLYVSLRNSVTDPRYITEAMTSTVELNARNNWTATVNGLPMYLNGEEIEYTWAEPIVIGYSAASEKSGTVTTLTNTHTPETVDLTVRKEWIGDGQLPAQINMVLSNGSVATLTAANGWSAVVTGLPKYAGGQEIVYTWTEPAIPGFTQTGMRTEGGVTVFTNRATERRLPTGPYTLTVHYRYADGTEASGDVVEVHMSGDGYSVVSPVIPGYKSSLAVVSGTMPNRDVEIVVIYVPEDEILIEDFETPLGLGDVFINVGDCYE